VSAVGLREEEPAVRGRLCCGDVGEDAVLIHGRT
jgi:hypothetical protein